MMEIRASILIVDDQPALRDNLRLTLELAGYAVATASDGVEAIEILQCRPIDLILADIAMPRMDGYQLCERIHMHRQWMRIPFLFLSARTSEWEIRYGMSLGADDYLAKPIEPEDLLGSVHLQIGRAQQLEQRIANVVQLGELC